MSDFTFSVKCWCWACGGTALPTHLFSGSIPTWQQHPPSTGAEPEPSQMLPIRLKRDPCSSLLPGSCWHWRGILLWRVPGLPLHWCLASQQSDKCLHTWRPVSQCTTEATRILGWKLLGSGHFKVINYLEVLWFLLILRLLRQSLLLSLK